MNSNPETRNSKLPLSHRRSHRVHDARLGRADMRFQRWAVGHRHVERRDPPDRRLQFVKAGLGDARGDLGSDAAALMGFIGDHDAMMQLDLNMTEMRHVFDDTTERTSDQERRLL